MEYWYDPKHTGCIRIIDYENQRIYGSDPNEPYWTVTFEKMDSHTLIVNFKEKKTHHGKNVLVTKLKDRNNTLHWEDGNKWRRIRQNPMLLINKIKLTMPKVKLNN